MKFTILSVLAFITAALAATTSNERKSVIVSWENDCPDSVVEKAKAAIVDAGGIITHEYKLIKGFAAQAPQKILEAVQALDTKYAVTVEEDQMVSIVGGKSS